MGVLDTHSSPGYPQSNGLAERTIQTIKCALTKAAQTITDPHLVLLSLRNTPVTGLDVTPAQVLMGRALRSTLTCLSATLKQSIPQWVHDWMQDLQVPSVPWSKCQVVARIGSRWHCTCTDALLVGTSHPDRSKTRPKLLQCADTGRADFKEKQETSVEDTFQSVQRHRCGWRFGHCTLSGAWFYSTLNSRP